ncbi:MAG: Holliday junction resolvase RuvX [Acidimicrobiales bacterium]|jgi:putative Holliday junction resolvase|nr:Holliday junction resolvase RuvX [Acidimicrobiales bacterium]
MRAVGVDLGSKRIGIAISDSDGMVATPYEVVKRSGDREQDHRRIHTIISEVEAEILVVGLPLSLNGEEGRAAQGARHEAEEIKKDLKIPVVMHDERYTTVEAERSLKEQDLNAVQRRKIIDKVAATVLLQAWLDGQ